MEARAGATDVEVGIRRPAAYTLRIVDATGRPLADCRAWLHRSLDLRERFDLRTGATGEVRLDSLDPDATYEVSIHPPALRTDLGVLGIHGWRPRDDELVLPPGGIVRGVVVDGPGNRVGGARVRAGDATPWPANVDGSFTLRHLPAGPVRLAATAGGRKGEARVTVPAGGTARVTITVR